ncbi:MAG: hypothetical protein ACRD5M_05055 [Candidatus Acidiferrales bacterium]
MGSIPGPVIRFRLDQASVSAGIKPAMNEIRAAAKTTSDAVAEDWRRAAAQIRASVSTAAVGDKDILAARTELVATLNKEIEGLRTRESLTKSQLANLKAQTLEIERQASHLKGTGGLTSGTASALNQVSLQTTLGVERILDSLVNRYFGGAAGAATRLVRDVSYYSAQAGGATSGGVLGGGAGILGGLSKTFSAITETIGPATLAVGGFGLALGTVAAVSLAVTHHMMETAQSIENMSAATDLSTKQVQEYNQLAKEMDLDVGALTNVFSRLQVQLGEYITKGKSADESTQSFVKVTSELGVKLADAQGKLRPINDIIGDFSEKLRLIPDAASRTALQMEAVGVRGKILAEAMNIANVEGKSLKQILDEIGASKVVIDDRQIQRLLEAKEKWDELKRAIEGAKIETEGFIAGSVLGFGKLLSDMKNLPKEIGDALNFARYGGFLAAGAYQRGLNPSSPGSNPLADANARKQFTADLIKQADQIIGTSRIAVDLEEKRKELIAAEKSGENDRIIALAQQVKYLEDAVKLEREREGLRKRIFEQAGRSPARVGLSAQEKVDKILENLINPNPNVAPEIAGTGSPIVRDYLGGLGLSSGVAKPPLDALALLRQIDSEYDDLFKTQETKAKEHFSEMLNSLNKALSEQLITQREYSDALVKVKADEAKTLADSQDGEQKKSKEAAGKLFDALLTGNSRKISEVLRKTVEDIALAPIKEIFEKAVAAQFSDLSKIFEGLFSKKTPGVGGATAGSAGTAATTGGFWNSIKVLFGGGNVIGPGGTAGTFPGPIIGAPGSTGGSVGIGANQVGVSTQNMYVSAKEVFLAGSIALPGSGSLGGSNLFGNFFGNLNPLAGGGGGGFLGFGGSGSAGSGGGGLGGAFQSLFGKGGGGFLGFHFPGSSALGALAIAGGSALYGLGTKTGGALGGLEAGLGGALTGAEIGSMILPGIGTAVGAIIGGITGLVSGILGGPSYQQKVKNAMELHNYIAPPGETFSFAQGSSIAQTLSTGFSLSGSHVNTFGLPANTPFWARALTGKLNSKERRLLQLEQLGIVPTQPFLGFPPIDPFIGQGPLGNRASGSNAVQVHIHLPGLVDPHMATQVFTQHGEMLARIVSSKLGGASSGFGWNVRRAVILP